jgi:tetratricopeptide (TPR) repeat protein
MKSCIAHLGLIILILSSCQTENKQVNVSDVSIVFKDSSGRSIVKDDLKNITGQVNYEITSDQNIDQVAINLHDEARELGQVGKYDSAIIKLQQAIKLQPDWPYPSYDLAFTYLLKGDFENALAYYQKTDQLAPEGFFTAKTALYTLQGEKAGRFPKGLYAKYMTIEWESDVNKKIQIARALLSTAPEFAPAWKEIAVLSDSKEDKEKAIEQGLSKNPDAETKGILLINKAIVLNDSGKKDEATKLLGDYIFSANATKGNIELAKYTLKSITE